MKHLFLLAVTLVALTFSATASAQYANEIPTIDGKANEADAAQVNYVTGGIGDDERAAIEATKSSYNVYVMSASANGAFVEDTQVVITKKDGSEVLNVNAGPLLYVSLPTGSYTLTATHGDDSKTQRIVIGGKKRIATVHLSWKVPANVADEQ